MSLQVWLPLNGSLKNQGLNNITITNNNATINNNGKIGQCYSFNGSNNYIRMNYNFYNTQYSVSAWVYSTSASATQTICCDRTTTGSGFSIFLIGGKLRIDPGGNGAQWTTSYTYPINTWFHLCITYNGTKVSYYINGEFKESSNYTLNSSYWGNVTSIGASQVNNSSYSNYLNGRLNDFRIYNHALSDKEVEEISKGLVLHYKLNDKQFVNQNLFSLDKAIGNNATKTSVEKKNNSLILTSQAVNYGSFMTAASDYLTFTAGVTYTLSGHIKVIAKGTDNFSPRLCIRNSSNAIQVSETVSGNESDVTMTWTPASTITGYVSGINTWSNGSSNTTNAVTEFSNIKLEIGSIQTAWIPNINDKIYTALGYNILTFYDTSGYNYNGTTSGNIELIISARYDGGAKASTAANATITTTIEGLSAILANGTKYTLACWARPTGINANGWAIKLGSNTCGLWWAKSKARWVWNENDNGKRCANPTISADYTNWHHLVTTIDKTSVTAIVAKHYVDGAPAEGYTSQTWDGSSFTQPAGNNITCYLQNADLSDIRLYATCLTDIQIQELYNTSVTIDNLGNIYAREYNENDNLSITKIGEFECNTIYDDDELTNASILKTNKQIQGKTLYEY